MVSEVIPKGIKDMLRDYKQKKERMIRGISEAQKPIIVSNGNII